MEVSIVQIALIFIVTFIAAIDQFDLLESLYQPIVTGPIVGAILGNVELGLVVGGTYQLMTIGNMPIGGAQPPNAVIGGIMAAIFACTLENVDANAAVALAIPFALLGQYGVTLFFTLRAPLLEFFRGCAVNADTKGITKWTVVSEVILGLIFAFIVTLFFIGGQTFGQTIVDAIPEWLNTGLSLRRLRHPAQDHDEPRHVGLLLHGLRPRPHRDQHRGHLWPRPAHPHPHRLRLRLLGLPAADRAEGRCL